MQQPWMMTFTGRRVNPLNVRPSDVDIKDLAHHLACTNRWCGALREPVTVAQHSVMVSWLLETTPVALEGLLHDGSEAYLNDVNKFLKHTPEMAGYRAAERRAERAIARHFGLPVRAQMHPLIKAQDDRMARLEEIVGFGVRRARHFPLKPDVKSLSLTPWDWEESEEQFLMRYRELRRRR